jgi:hypothetical protein
MYGLVTRTVVQWYVLRSIYWHPYAAQAGRMQYYEMLMMTIVMNRRVSTLLCTGWQMICTWSI